MSNGCVEMKLLDEWLVADPSGALYWPREGVLIASDLHFEKGSSFAAKGQMLPPYDTRATLKILQNAIERHSPSRVIALGDSFHDGEAGDRIAPDDMAAIQSMTQSVMWTWITGNHDEVLPDGIGGSIENAVSIGPLVFRHEPHDRPADGELCGHLHPCAIVRTRNRKLRRRCFVGDGKRLILPAMGAFTGGLDIAEEPYEGLFETAPTAWVLGKDKVYTILPNRLVGVS